MRKQNLRTLYVVLFNLVISGCGSVLIRDAEWCGDMGTMGAACFHTLTDETRDIEKAAWDAERFGMVCTNSDNFAAVKAVIEKLCYQTKSCTYAEKEQIKKFFERVQTFAKNAQEGGGP